MVEWGEQDKLAKACNIIEYLMVEWVLTKVQVRRGVDLLLEDIDELSIDNPWCMQDISSVLADLNKRKIVEDHIITWTNEETLNQLK